MANLYLFLYNTVLCAGWGYCFYLTLLNILAGGTVSDLWETVEMPLKISQTAAFLEILHSAIKIVRSPLIVTTMQVFSRIWIVWGIINPVQFITTQQSLVLAKLGDFNVQLDLTSLLIAWSLAEIIRYSFFALKEIGFEVAFLKWLRYTVFIPLYPVGMGSELALVYLALPSLIETNLWSISLPNALNFAFSYYIYVIIYSLLYIPFFPQLYFYMLAQRKKVLGSKAKAE